MVQNVLRCFNKRDKKGTLKVTVYVQKIAISVYQLKSGGVCVLAFLSVCPPFLLYHFSASATFTLLYFSTSVCSPEDDGHTWAAGNRSSCFPLFCVTAAEKLFLQEDLFVWKHHVPTTSRPFCHRSRKIDDTGTCLLEVCPYFEGHVVWCDVTVSLLCRVTSWCCTPHCPAPSMTSLCHRSPSPPAATTSTSPSPSTPP